MLSACRAVNFGHCMTIEPLLGEGSQIVAMREIAGLWQIVVLLYHIAIYRWLSVLLPLVSNGKKA